MSLQQYDSSSPWQARISNANKAFDSWHSKFKCDRLEDYYENFQWKLKTDNPQINYQPYTLNLFHSTIKIKLAGLLFQRPSFILSPEPGHSHWDLDFAVQTAQLKQDVLNTIIKNRNIKFARHLKLASLDSFFRFGLIEVGYAADWRNPLKEDPELKSWDDESVKDSTRDRVVQDREVPVNERFYVKRIKPQRFRVSVADAEATDLEDHEWVGYYQHYYVDTLKHTKGIKFPESGVGAYVSSDFSDSRAMQKDSSGLYTPYRGREICKVWHIWDLVSGERKLLLADHEYTEMWSAPFERLPLIDLRWDLRLSGFYPIPPSWYWLSAQDEVNESREQIRSYRRRFTRKFQVLKGGADEEEKEKFVSGPDGILIEVKIPDAIKAIDNPEIGPTSEGALLQAKDDFNIASGTSAEARSQNADRETATAAKIVDVRAQIRENADQIDFSEFVCTVGREILSQCQEKLVDGLWVKYSSDPSMDVGQELQINAPIIKWITAQEISDGHDFSIEIDIQNATPAAMQQAQQAFVNFVMFLQQVPMVAMSPILIREAAFRFGYKNEKVIQQMQKVAIASMEEKMQNIQGGPITQSMQPGGGQSNTAQKQMQTPDQGTIQTQLNNQLQ